MLSKISHTKKVSPFLLSIIYLSLCLNHHRLSIEREKYIYDELYIVVYNELSSFHYIKRTHFGVFPYARISLITHHFFPTPFIIFLFNDICDFSSCADFMSCCKYSLGFSNSLLDSNLYNGFLMESQISH